jgi:hypothetical protein
MLDEDRIAALVRSRLTEREAASSIVRWDTVPKRAGEALRLGRDEHEMPFDGYFVFVDLLPMANWAHPARALLIDSEGERVEAVEVRFPPFADAAYPPSFRVVDLAGIPG